MKEVIKCAKCGAEIKISSDNFLRCENCGFAKKIPKTKLLHKQRCEKCNGILERDAKGINFCPKCFEI